MHIKCSNEPYENCTGEFVLTIYDTCYFFHKINKIYRVFEKNNLCLERNQSEIDFPTVHPDVVIFYLLNIFNKDMEFDHEPFSFFSKNINLIILLKKYKIFLV